MALCLGKLELQQAEIGRLNEEIHALRELLQHSESCELKRDAGMEHMFSLFADLKKEVEFSRERGGRQECTVDPKKSHVEVD